MLFMPKETSKKALKELHENWLKEKRIEDQKRREEYLKNKQNNA